MTPFPSIDRADLVAGTAYTTRLLKPNITLTLPRGEWLAVGADSADHVEIEPAAMAAHRRMQVGSPDGIEPIARGEMDDGRN